MATRLLTIWIAILCWNSGFNAFSRSEMSQNLKTAREKYLNLNFKYADHFVNNEQIKNPGNTYIDYVKSYGYFIRSVIGTTSNNQDLFLNFSDKALDQLENTTVNRSFNRACMTELYFMRSAVFYQQGNYFRMALNLIRSIDLIENNLQNYPDNPEHFKNYAVYHLVLSALPDEYKTVTGLCGYSGSMQKGMEYLEKYYAWSLTQKDTIEPLVFKALALNIFADDPAAAIRLIESHQELSVSNPLLRFVYAFMLMRDNQAEKAIRIINQYPDSQHLIPYFDYMLGTSMLYKLDPQCCTHLNRFLSQPLNNDFRLMALQKLYWYYTAVGQSDNSVVIADRIKEIGADPTMDKIWLGNYTSKNASELLKSRLHFDGGYYTEAENALNRISQQSLNNELLNLEYLYRKARIYQKTGKTDAAFQCFNQVIEKGKHINHYYAAFSALQMGSMAENKGDKNQAIQYYHIAINLESGEYSNYIARKSKSALYRLKE